MMVQSFEKSSGSDAVGVIGIQGNDDEKCGECAFHVFESMIYFEYEILYSNISLQTFNMYSYL